MSKYFVSVFLDHRVCDKNGETITSELVVETEIDESDQKMFTHA